MKHRAAPAQLVTLALALSSAACRDARPPAQGESSASSTDAAAWRRPAWTATEDEAWLFFAVLGEFPSERPPFDPTAYRSTEPGRGFETREFRGQGLEQLVGVWSAGPVGRALERDAPELWRAVRAAPECLALDVRVPDAPDCDHLRNAIGLVTHYADLGGAVVLDPLTLRAWSPADWRASVFEPGRDALSDQIVVRWSVEGGDPSETHAIGTAPAGLAPDAAVWIRTRGLRKVARPDLSLRATPVERFDEAAGLVQELVRVQLDGAVLPTGEAVMLPGWPSPVGCELTGDPDDPEFVNVHYELSL